MSAAVSCGSFGGKKKAAETELDDSTKTAMEMERMRMEEPEYIIETTHGTMKVKLYSKTPKHRENFAKLVSENYYDGIFARKGINTWVDVWGTDVLHDWDWWYKQVAYFVPKMLG